ncbi:MAG TPA: hypothetical protein VIY86_11825 [Pirellulaceae bacterium]
MSLGPPISSHDRTQRFGRSSHRRFGRDGLKWLCLLFSGLAGCAGAQEAGQTVEASPARPLDPAKIEFTRLVRDFHDRSQTLEVAIVRYRPKKASSPIDFVDLIGAIHVADAPYYEELNRRFRNYDAVLYELVAPEGTRIPKGSSTTSSVSALQRVMKRMLGLHFQLEEIDYTRRNLIHADLSPEEFAESMRERGETWLGLFLRIMTQSMARDSQKVFDTSEKELFAALFAKDRELRLKRLMAEQFADLESVLAMYEGANGSTLLSERNRRAVKVLGEQIERGQRRLAIFYGAAHMRDMAARISEDYGLVPVRVEWLPAWDLRSREERSPTTSRGE